MRFSMKLRTFLAVFCAIVIFHGCMPDKQSDDSSRDHNPLVGAWLITRATTETPEGTWTDYNPQPGVYLFTKSFFSNMLVPDGERRLFDSETTDAERLAAFTNFVADCGTYEVNDSTLVTRNIVAKLPNAMYPNKESGISIAYQFRFENGDLLLTLDSAWAPAGGKIIYRLRKLE